MSRRDWGNALSIILGLGCAKPDLIGPVKEGQRLYTATEQRVNQYREERIILTGFATVEDGEFLSHRSRHTWTMEKVSGSAVNDALKDPKLKAARDLAAEQLLADITKLPEAET